MIFYVTGKVKANNDYIGHPPPDRGRTALAFELNDVIELLNKDEPTWWEVSVKTVGFHTGSLVYLTLKALIFFYENHG